MSPEVTVFLLPQLSGTAVFPREELKAIKVIDKTNKKKHTSCPSPSLHATSFHIARAYTFYQTTALQEFLKRCTQKTDLKMTTQ